jgi:hypothetical protein
MSRVTAPSGMKTRNRRTIRQKPEAKGSQETIITRRMGPVLHGWYYRSPLPVTQIGHQYY